MRNVSGIPEITRSLMPAAAWSLKSASEGRWLDWLFDL